MAEFIPAVLFVLSSGLLFQKQFRENPVLVVIAGLIGLVSSYFLFDQLATILNKFREPDHQVTQTTPAPTLNAQAAATPAEKNLNDRVASAVAKGRQFEIDAREQASNAAIVADQAQDAAEKARSAAETAKTATSGYLRDDKGTTPDGDTYSYFGEVEKERTYNGVGVIKWGVGDRYEGEWLHGARTGVGVHYMHEGQIQSGQFEDTHFSGLGRVDWSSKDRYEGQLRDSNCGQLGVYMDHDGTVYTGQYSPTYAKYCVLNGYGAITYADRSEWVGQWHNGKLNGYGAKFDEKGKLVEQGIYENDKLQQSLTP